MEIRAAGVVKRVLVGEFEQSFLGGWVEIGVADFHGLAACSTKIADEAR